MREPSDSDEALLIKIRHVWATPSTDVWVWVESPILVDRGQPSEGWGEWLLNEFKRLGITISTVSARHIVAMVRFYASDADNVGKSIYRGDRLTVDSRLRRLGIATQMYRYARDRLALTIRPNIALTKDGKAFWKSLTI